MQCLFGKLNSISLQLKIVALSKIQHGVFLFWNMYSTPSGCLFQYNTHLLQVLSKEGMGDGLHGRVCGEDDL